MPHLLVAISPHGYGHLSQVAPVLRRVRQRLPDLHLTLRTTLPEQLLRQRIGGDFTLQAVADDFGMVQRNALAVDREESLFRYRRLHKSWQQHVERVAGELARCSPDLVFADVPYLTLAAARHAGIPSLAMCSLNWHAILQGYLSPDNNEQALLEQMLDAYASAECFLRPEPSMPMPLLGNQKAIGVVAHGGNNRRQALVAEGLAETDERLVLVALGGIAHRIPLERWPVMPGYRFVVPAAWDVRRDDCSTIESADMDFSDLLASVDAVITKPGYGTFTESAVNAVPVMYVRRGDWPEEPCLVDWLQRNARCCEVTLQALEEGRIESELASLIAGQGKLSVEADGVEEAASAIVSRLA